MLEDQQFSFCRLEEDLIRVVSLDGPGDRLTSRGQVDNNLLALERGDESLYQRLSCTLCFFFHEFSVHRLTPHFQNCHQPFSFASSCDGSRDSWLIDCVSWATRLRRWKRFFGSVVSRKSSGRGVLAGGMRSYLMYFLENVAMMVAQMHLAGRNDSPAVSVPLAMRLIPTFPGFSSLCSSCSLSSGPVPGISSHTLLPGSFLPHRWLSIWAQSP